MTAPQFDTLRAAKTLKRGGFDETQAETVVNTLDQAVNENLGTKTDLNLLRGEMKQDFTKTNAAAKQGFVDAKAATDKLRSDTNQGFTKSEAATDKLRSDTNQGFTDANAATKQGFAEAKAATDKLRSDTNQGFTKSEVATDKLRSEIEKAFTKSEAANEKRFATLYRYLLGAGATIVVIMITLFVVN